MKKKYNKIVCLSVILILLIPFLISAYMQFGDYPISTPKLSDIDWDRGDGKLSQFNNTINERDDLQTGIYYNFTSDLIDLNNCSHDFDAGFFDVEFYNGEWLTDLDADNITVQDLINYNDYISGFEDFYDIVGDLSDWVDLSLNDVNDMIYSIFDSTEVEYYPATFDFNDDTIGAVPIGWDNDVEAIIVDSWESHRNVLQLTRDGSNPEIEQVFDSVQTSGIIELYAGSTDVTQLSHIRLYDGASSVIQINLYEDKLQYRNGGAYNPILDPIFDDIWYHIKIVFECGDGGYEGLAADTIYVYVDGVQYGPYPFNNVAPHVDKIYLISNSAAVYYFYIDAVGYSWDTDYLLGDNYNWNYYPATHDLENYDVTLSGNYNGTYSFEDESVGTTGVAIDFINVDNSVGTGYIDIIPFLDGHNNVLRAHVGVGADDALGENIFDSPQTSGTVEFWFRITDASMAGQFQLRDGATIAVNTQNYQDFIRSYNGGTNNIVASVDNTWYHIRIDFECGAGGYQGLVADTHIVYVNDVKYGAYAFDNVVDSVDRFSVGGNINTFDHFIYYDAIAYLWDTDYCQPEPSWNYDNDFKSWNTNPYNLSYLFQDNWDYRGVVGGDISIDGEFGTHKKYLELLDNSNTGFFRATYSFEDDTLGSLPAGFIDDSGGTGHAIVIDNIDGHNSVVELYHGPLAADDGGMTRSFLAESGTIELWWRLSEATLTSNIVVFEGAAQVILFRVTADVFQIHNGVGYQTLVTVPLDNTWHHIRFDFECGAGLYKGLAADTQHIYIDGFDEGVWNFNGVANNLERIWFWCGSTAVYYAYYDAVEFSWDDDNYIVGDNTNDIGIQVWNNFTTDITEGNLSFWMYGDFDNGYEHIRVYLMNDLDFITSIKIDASFLYYLDGRDWIKDCTVTNAWHYFRMDFNTTTDTYDLWFDYTDYSYCDDGINVDLTLIDSDIPFQQTTTGIDTILFETTCGADVPTYKIDALSYSWVNSSLDLNLIPTTYAELDFKVSLDISDPDYICYRLYWAFLTTSSEYVNFTWYNFDTDTWDVIIRDYFDGGAPPLGFTEYYNYTYFDDDSLDPYVNSSGDMLFRIKILDLDEEFDFYLDEFRLLLRDYVSPTIIKVFDYPVIWRYRWWLRIEWNSTWLWSNWTYFNIIPLFGCANFEGISESEYTTFWELIDNDAVRIGGFSDDMTTGSWYSDVGLETFKKSAEEGYTNYLVDNFTLSGDVGEFTYTGTYWDIPYSSRSVTWDGTNFWIVVDSVDDVYQYTVAGVNVPAGNFDVGTEDSYPKGIIWDGTHFWMVGSGTDEVYQYTAAGVYTTVHFDVGVQATVPTGITWDGTNFWIVDDTTNEVYQYTAAGVYTTVHFDVGVQATVPTGITWDGTNFWIVDDTTNEVYQYTNVGVYTGMHFDVGTEATSPQGIAWDGTYFWITDRYSYSKIYQYGGNLDISKWYHGGGYTYIQTNITETLNLKRTTPYATNYTVYAGQCFEIELQSSASDVLMKLYSNGILNTTLIILEDNIDSSRRSFVITIPSDITFDQIEFIGTAMEDTEHFVCYDIFVGEYDTNEEGYYSMFIDPDGKDDLMCQFGDYILRIWDEVVVVEDVIISRVFAEQRNITLTYEYDLMSHTYIPLIEWNLKIYHYAYETSTIEIYLVDEIDYTTSLSENTTAGYNEIIDIILDQGSYIINWTNGENGVINTYNITLDHDQSLILSSTFYSIYFSLYDQNHHRLDDSLFSLYLNNSRKDFGFVELNTPNYTITVFDYLNVSVFNQIVYLASYNEYNIFITVFEFQIRHLGTENSNITLYETTTHSGLNFSMAPDTIRGFTLASSTYNITWTNGENMASTTYNITLDTNYILTLESSYHSVYIGLFTYDGLGVNHDYVRFYINGNRRDFGFNTVQSETAELVVLDFFNNTLANETIDVSAYLEYNLYIQIYSMYILNRFTYNDLIMNITQVGSGYNMSQLIPASSALLYRFIPNVNYTINATYINGTIYNIRTINLTDNSQVESFGIPSTPEEYPKDVYFGIYTTTGLGIDHDLLRFYIDGNRVDFGFNRIENEMITLLVRDYFNTTLFTQVINTSGIYEYNILITLYSLKIKNEARVATNYTLSFGALETTGFILPEEIIEYQLSSNNYVFNYTNNENGITSTININLNQDRVYILNSTYYTTYFSLYDQNGVRLDDTLFSLFLNGTRKDFGFVELTTTDILIVVYDYLNFTAFNSVITLSGFTEYNIIITVFELQIRHLARENSNLTMFETTIHNHVDFLMSPNSLTWFMLSSSTYNVTWVNGENNISIIYDINLYTNYILTLNTSYYDIFFSLYDVNLHIIDYHQYVFRLNGTIQDFGFVVDLQTDNYTITVVDRFETSLFNNIINLRGLNEYRINITLFELQIRHLGEENSNLSLYETVGHSGLNFSMAPNSIRSFILGSSTYNITWTNGENSVATVYDITLNTDYILTLNTSYYNIYFSLFDVNLNLIDLRQYVFRLNGTIEDFGFIMDLKTDEYVITVVDRFGVSLFNNVVFLRGLNEYRIDITLFELQIRHLATENSNISLYETTLHNSLNFSMAPDTIRPFILANSTYNVTWINGEDGISMVYNINLNLDYILTLNTTYYAVYFSLYDQGGIRLEDSLFSLYINATRKDFGFVGLETDDNLILVQDRLNVTVFNQVVALRIFNEYNIIITVFELQIRHLARENSNITLYETITHNGLNFSMSPDSLNKYILSNSTYNITWVNGENDISTVYNIILNENYILTLNTSYYNIYFSLNDLNLNLINLLHYEFKLNGTIEDFGFIMDLQTDDYNITVTDRFGTYLFNNTINLRGLNQYRIDITLYELQIRHLARENSNINFTEVITSNNYTFIMTPNSIKSIIVGSADYTLDWTNGENGLTESIPIALTTDRVVMLNTSYYNIHFSLFDVNLHDFILTQYEFRLNNTIQDLGLVVDLQTDNYNITITDRFGISLFNNIINLRGLNEYRINITLFELQIRHLGEENSNLTLTDDILGTNYTFIMMPDSFKSIIIGSSNYTLNWTNGENSVITLFPINLTLDIVIKLNSSYFEVYFGLYTNDGLGIDRDTVRFYVNSDRKDFGEVLITQDTNTLLVRDYFNQTLYSASVNLRPYIDGEWNIFVNIFTLNLFNNYTYLIDIEIERNGIEIKCTIPPQMSFEYRFLPNVKYTATWYYENGTKIDDREFEFDENGQIESFGFYEVEVPYDPLPDLTSALTQWGIIIIFVCIFGVISIVIYYKYKMKKLEMRKRDPMSTYIPKMKDKQPFY